MAKKGKVQRRARSKKPSAREGKTSKQAAAVFKKYSALISGKGSRAGKDDYDKLPKPFIDMEPGDSVPCGASFKYHKSALNKIRRICFECPMHFPSIDSKISHMRRKHGYNARTSICRVCLCPTKAPNYHTHDVDCSIRNLLSDTDTDTSSSDSSCCWEEGESSSAAATTKEIEKSDKRCYFYADASTDSIGDEELLSQGLALVDDLQRVLGEHDATAAGIPFHEDNSNKGTYPASSRSPDFQREEAESAGTEPPPSLNLSEIQNARDIMDVLAEVLNALDLANREGVRQEVIVDLVSQCQNYKQRVVHLVNSTADEELLSQGFTLNDDLQRVLGKHDAIAAGIPFREDNNNNSNKGSKDKEAENKPKQRSLQQLDDIEDNGASSNRNSTNDQDRESGASTGDKPPKKLPGAALTTGAENLVDDGEMSMHTGADLNVSPGNEEAAQASTVDDIPVEPSAQAS